MIGILKNADMKSKDNYGSFIGEIFNNNKDLNNNIKNAKIKNNYIIGEIYISKENVGKYIRIINSYEEYCRESKASIKQENRNEKEIKECNIEINDNKIAFCYFFKFSKKGKYKIKYIFEKYLTEINNIFSDCFSLINLDLSNFNTQNATHMNGMFSNCSSLVNLNLSNFNTIKVISMSWMFSNCSSLTNLDL